MADEPTTPTLEPQAAPAASPPPAAPGGDPAPAATAPEQPSIGDLLNWNVEEKGELSAEQRALLTPEAIREWHTSETERIRTEAQSAAEARAAAESADREIRTRQQGEAQQDIDFYENLKARLYSENTETAAAALKELQQNEARYNRGGALAAQRGAEAQQREVLTGLFSAMHSELEGAGLNGILPQPGSAEWKILAVELAKYDGKGGFAAYLIDKGKALGVEEGRAAATEEFQRNGRINEGKSGGPEGGSQTDPGNRFGDRAWVEDQIKAHGASWRLAPSGKKDANGRDLTNNDLIMQAMARR